MGGFVQGAAGKILFLSLFLHPFVSMWMATPPFGRVQEYWMFICSLENSLIRFLICVEFLGIKVCGILSINRIFRLEWEFLKSAGKLFV